MSGLAPSARVFAGWAIAATIALVVLACTRAASEAEPPGTPRIVTVGGAVTETVFALGAGAQVVAVDTSSVHPAEATRLPQLGYQRQLAAEAVLAQRPTLVVAAVEAGPPAALEQLRAAGVRVEVMPQAHTPAAAAARVRAVAAAIGAVPAGEALAARVEVEAAASSARAQRSGARPRVVFVYARGGGNIMVSGSGTAAAAMIELAGATNAATGFDGFKPLSPEAMIAAQPDAIVVLTRGLEAAGGVDGILAMPGVAETPAGKGRRVVAMDDLLFLGFGPRLPEAIDELSQRLAAASSAAGPV